MSNVKIIAIANQKGGVAKTTSALALGTALADRGQRVLLGTPKNQAIPRGVYFPHAARAEGTSFGAS
jgi:hypothetical protein